MVKRTTRREQVEVSTDLSSEAVFAVVADLRSLPQWWFWREPHPDIEYPQLRVLEVDGGGLTAALGVRVVVEALSAVMRVGRRQMNDPDAGPYRFTCDAVESDVRIRLLHNPDGQPADDGVVATELRISRDGERARVALVRESVIEGRGVRAMVMRWGHQHGRRTLERALRRILVIAEAGTAGKRIGPGT